MTDVFRNSLPKQEKAFDGDTYEVARDHARLTGQLLRVFNVMRDSIWRDLSTIAVRCGGTEALGERETA